MLILGFMENNDQLTIKLESGDDIVYFCFIVLFRRETLISISVVAPYACSLVNDMSGCAESDASTVGAFERGTQSLSEQCNCGRTSGRLFEKLSAGSTQRCLSSHYLSIHISNTHQSQVP